MSGALQGHDIAAEVTNDETVYSASESNDDSLAARAAALSDLRKVDRSATYDDVLATQASLFDQYTDFAWSNSEPSRGRGAPTETTATSDLENMTEAEFKEMINTEYRAKVFTTPDGRIWAEV